jgi:hypothetical protein
MRVHTTVTQAVDLDKAAVEEVFRGRLYELCGSDGAYLNEKTGEVEEWYDTGHGSGITDVVDKAPSELKLAALKLRKLLEGGR